MRGYFNLVDDQSQHSGKRNSVRNKKKMALKTLKPEQIYQHLKELAEKMNITVCEQSFRNAGIHVKSGLCKIKGQDYFIMNKDLTIRKKTTLLADCLSHLPHEEIYVLPVIRDLLSTLTREGGNNLGEHTR
jgi:hypothetical protein